MEIWKSCAGWEGLYEVSNLGNVRSLHRKTKANFGDCVRGGTQLNKVVTSRGYEVVNFTNGKKRSQIPVHKLVLVAFVGDRPTNFDGCHKNGIKTDNTLANLRWDTKSGNHKDKKIHGTWQVGMKANNVKYNDDVVIDIRKNRLSPKIAFSKYGISKSQTRRILSGVAWPHIQLDALNVTLSRLA